MAMARRQHLSLLLGVALFIFFSISYLLSGRNTAGLATSDARFSLPKSSKDPDSDGGSKSKAFKIELDDVPKNLLDGPSIAPAMDAPTAKAELGRATWKFLHTVAARFPEKPTPDERKTLETFFHLFGRLYPCGECAKHFRELMKQYPPQTSSRNAAAGWLCFAHNLVNQRLKKPEFDCNKIGDFYDCGCGEEGKDGKGKGKDKDKDKDKEESKSRTEGKGKGDEEELK
ncbi:hypothetical protein DCS_05096 [Drechmeria coniospora]|uniref:Sulfhydryl oxidase n=1 Tax=Drechmeria coniospora TaxID=98403 RepID=A0A151GLV3_DRECN|nr:hypothetical protein DCS_05096 [Drechmeria coniospora]KYK58083.1 hypothetical protein DCS_05096 [Drechmeria coniospora]ODA83081.1 hypothetical protein RJ55_01590 [Drechmeria coniospora]